MIIGGYCRDDRAIEVIHGAVRWFVDVDMTVLYVDDGISKDTLNMSLAP